MDDHPVRPGNGVLIVVGTAAPRSCSTSWSSSRTLIDVLAGLVLARMAARMLFTMR